MNVTRPVIKLRPSRSPLALTICIPSLHTRHQLLAELLAALRQQPRIDEVEIVSVVDGGQTSVGEKRNQMVANARGRYICHVDDDDMVGFNYVPSILAAIDANPSVDVVMIRGKRTMRSQPPVLFDYRLDSEHRKGWPGAWDNGVLWRSPGHLCPVRADLAKQVPFPFISDGEDLQWVDGVQPLLKTSARAGASNEVLYFYRFEPEKGPRPKFHVQPPASSSTHMDHRAIFTPQYTHFSGPGSTPAYSAPYRGFLASFIAEHQIKSILDLGCGDLEVMSRVAIGRASYLGVDVIAQRIAQNQRKHRKLRFDVGDARTYPINADLLVVKDVLQHWNTAEVTAWLERLQTSAFRFALITNCNYGPTVNTDCPTGQWRALDLTQPPFGVGRVVFTWGDDQGGIKDTVLIEKA
jgi:hypothetical protein